MYRHVSWSRLFLLKDFGSPSSRLVSVGRCVELHGKVRCLSNAADDTELGGRPQSDHPTSTVKVLYDGECNICIHEIRLLRKIARQRPVHFVDITTPEFSADRFGGITYEMAMREMHVIGADGKVHVQADAIREMYRACGLGWLAAVTQLPGLEAAFNTMYMQFALYRLKAALDRCDSGVSCSIKLKHLRDKLRPPQRSEG